MHSTDLNLYAQWRRERNAAAFNELARRHAAMVFGTCQRILRSAADAEEVAQECFEALAVTAQGPDQNLGGWLHALATRRALNRLKSETRRREREQAFAEAHATTAEVHWDDIYPLVDEAITALPDKLREPLIRNFFEGQTHEAIAAELGVSRGAVTYRIAQGVERIRKYLKQRGVIAGPTALSAMLMENLVGAETPATLTDAIARMALAGPPTVTATVAASSVVALGKQSYAVACAVTLLAIGVVAWFALPRDPGGVPLPPLAEITLPLPERAETMEVVEGFDSDLATEPGHTSGPPIFTAVIGGRVVDSDLRPVAGAEVTLERHFEHHQMANWKGADPLPPYQAAQITKDNGVFEFTEAPFLVDTGRHNGYYTFLLRTSVGETGAIQTLHAASLSPNNHVDLALESFGVISGRVLDSNGLSVTRPNIRLWRRIANRDGFQVVPVPDPRFEFGEGGQFRIRTLPAELYTLRVRGDGHPARSLDAFVGQENITVTLPAPLQVTGKVVNKDTGRGVPGVKLIAWADTAEPHETTTDGQGGFSIGEMAPEHHFLRLVMGNQPLAMDPITERLDLRPGKPLDDLELTVYQGGAVTGRVVDGETGTVLPGIAVQASIPDQPYNAGGSLGWRVMADEAGAFRIEGLPRGGYVSFAEALGAKPSKRLEVYPGRLYEGVELEVHPGVRITGVALDEEENPVEGAWVVAAGQDGPLPEKVCTDASGKFELRTYRQPARGGTIRLQGMDAHRVSTATDPVSLDTLALSNTVLRLKAGYALSGEVRYASGRPAAGATVIAISKTVESDVLGLLDTRPPQKDIERGAAAATVSKSGRFHFAPLPSGAYTVVAYPAIADATDFAASTNWEAARNSGPIQLVFNGALEQQPVLRGRVTLAGSPVAGAQVSLAPENPEARYRSAITAVDGSYRMEGILPGTATISTSCHGTDQPSGCSWTAAPIAVEIKETGETIADVALGTGSSTVSGSVRQGGNPVAGILVSVRQESGTSVHMTTKEDGAFELRNVLEGNIDIIAVKSKQNADDDAWNQSLKASIAIGERLIVDFTLGSGELAGVVTGVNEGDTTVACLLSDTLETLPSFQEAMKLGGINATAGCAPCDQDGTFRIQNAPAGVYTLIVLAIRENAEGDGVDEDSYQAAMAQVEIADGELTEVELELNPVDDGAAIGAN